MKVCKEKKDCDARPSHLHNTNDDCAKLRDAFDEGQKTDEAKHPQRSDPPTIAVADESKACHHHREVERIETVNEDMSWEDVALQQDYSGDRLQILLNHAIWNRTRLLFVKR